MRLYLTLILVVSQLTFLNAYKVSNKEAESTLLTKEIKFGSIDARANAYSKIERY
ncbi:hypothetical protein H1P_10005 [Hyella patelloides LEGE 07179]|uniref:Uncharacterized protein n=1 Tax=Hyella patelloides LEGE 07179 TaxID=945734 RepID=A0A563VIJ0_9CYAN|nr:hypothetical protein H1P_10005 [Hyella patelloides LEGE 07179]